MTQIFAIDAPFSQWIFDVQDGQRAFRFANQRAYTSIAFLGNEKERLTRDHQKRFSLLGRTTAYSDCTAYRLA